MAKKEYLTVAEFAAAAGVSKQAVYQRLKGTLKPFVKVEQGQKVIDISALNFISENSDFKSFNSRLNNGVESTPHRDTANQNDYLLQSLMEQLKEKDCQLAEKDKQIAQLLKLNDQQQQLTLQAQNLLDRPSSTGNEEDISDDSHIDYDNYDDLGLTEEDYKRIDERYQQAHEKRLNLEREVEELRQYKAQHEKGFFNRLRRK